MTEDKNDDRAGLIHPAIPDVDGTKARPIINDVICANPEDCCRELSRIWAALGITGPNGKSASENVAAIRRIAHQLVIEAKMATNALACLARAQYQHAEVGRLHIAIGLLEDQLIGSVSEVAGEASASPGRSAAPDSSSRPDPLPSPEGDRGAEPGGQS